MLDRPTLRIGLAKSGLALLRVRGWRGQRAEVAVERCFARDAAAASSELAVHLNDAVGQALAADASRSPTSALTRASIVLADEWLRLWMTQPPSNAARMDDCRAGAAMRYQTLYGESMQGWTVSAHWDARHPFLACAIPDSLLAALHATAREHRLALIEIVPQCVAVWNARSRRRDQHAWFGVLQQNHLTLWMFDRQRLSAVSMVTLPDDFSQDGQWLAEHARRESLRRNLQLPDSIELHGTVPAETHPKPGESSPATILHRMRVGKDGSESAHVVLARSGMRA